MACLSLTALVLLNSVARWCFTTYFYKNGVIYMLVCMGVGRILSMRALVNFFKSFSRVEGPKVMKFGFTTQN